MEPVRELGKTLLVFGVLLLVIGAALVLAARSGGLPFRIGRLPGDIVYHGRHTTFYFPLVTCLLLSGVLTLLFWLLHLFRR